MYFYSFFGLAIRSEVELPDLAPGDGEADIVIRIGRVPDGPVLASMKEEVAFHEAAGTFHIRNGSEIVVAPAAGGNQDLLRVLLQGRMMAFLLRQRGWLPLHASVVSVNGSGVLFVGPSGSGKSTIAAVLDSHGYPVVSDDIGAVRMDHADCQVRTAGSRIRLHEDALSATVGREFPNARFQWDKFSLPLDPAQAQKLPAVLPVRRIYLLEYGSSAAIWETSPANAVIELSRQSFVVPARMSREALAFHFRLCSALGELGAVRRLVRRQNLQELKEVIRVIEDDVGAR